MQSLQHATLVYSVNIGLHFTHTYTHIRAFVASLVPDWLGWRHTTHVPKIFKVWVCPLPARHNNTLGGGSYAIFFTFKATEVYPSVCWWCFFFTVLKYTVMNKSFASGKKNDTDLFFRSIQSWIRVSHQVKKLYWFLFAELRYGIRRTSCILR